MTPKSGTSELKIWQFFIQNPLKEFQPFEIAQALSLSRTTVNTCLRALEDMEKVQRREQGYCVYWRMAWAESVKHKLLYRKWDRHLFGVDLSE